MNVSPHQQLQSDADKYLQRAREYLSQGKHDHALGCIRKARRKLHQYSTYYLQSHIGPSPSLVNAIDAVETEIAKQKPDVITRAKLQAAVEHAWLMHPPREWKDGEIYRLPLTRLYPRINAIDTPLDFRVPTLPNLPYCECQYRYGNPSTMKITAPGIDPEFEWITPFYRY